MERTPPSAPQAPHGAPGAASKGGVRPIPVRDLHAIFAPRPKPKADLNARFAANDRYGPELTPRIGLFGFTVMALVAALIGAWLAIGHS